MEIAAPSGLIVSKTVPDSDVKLVCVACGHSGPAGRPALRANGTTLPFNLHRCRHCALVQQFPRAGASATNAQYNQSYYVFNEGEPRRWARTVQQYAVHIRQHESRAPRRLLDIGCALGHLCALAQKRGWRVTGLDVSAEAVSRAVDRFKIDARAGLLSRHVATLPRFDLIFLGDVLEHVPEPDQFLRDVHHALAPGGILCIDTPNWGSLWRRISGAGWLGINPFHINLFTADSLTALLHRRGFANIQTSSYVHYRYAAPGDRPEWRALIRALPRALAWRLNAAAGRIARFAAGSDLQRTPPDSLESAGALVESLSRTPPRRRPSRLRDNLVAMARKP